MAIIVDVEATREIRQAEVGAARTMIDRTEERLGLRPERLAADSANGSAEMLVGCRRAWRSSRTFRCFDKSIRIDGTFSRDDFTYDPETDIYRCPAARCSLNGTLVNDGSTLHYRASKYDCDICELKATVLSKDAFP